MIFESTYYIVKGIQDDKIIFKHHISKLINIKKYNDYDNDFSSIYN